MKSLNHFDQGSSRVNLTFGTRFPFRHFHFLMLERTVLNNVDDAAGRWQYEGGAVFEDKRQVGYYASTKRVTFGATDAQNTAMLTLEVFFTPQTPPQNIVLQGAHDFNSGGEIGSVSAASAVFAVHIGKEFQRVGNTLTVA